MVVLAPAASAVPLLQVRKPGAGVAVKSQLKPPLVKLLLPT